MSNPHALIKVTDDIVEDLKIWSTFLSNYNAKELYAPCFLKYYYHASNTDATLLGYGGVFEGDYFHRLFPDSWSNLDIQVKDFYPIFALISLKSV